MSLQSLFLSLALVGSFTVHPPNILAQGSSPAITVMDTMTSDTTVTFLPLSSDSGKRLGQLQKLLKAQMQAALASGRTLFVELGATWCPPCQRLESRIRKHDHAIVDAFAGAYVVHVDIDEWKWEEDSTEFHSLGFDGGVMPIIYAMDTTGNVVADLMQGDNAWLIKQFVRKHLWKRSNRSI